MDAGGRPVRGAGQLGQARELAVVDVDHAPGVAGAQGFDVRRLWRFAQAALGLADALELVPGLAAVEGVQCALHAGALGHHPTHLQHRTGHQRRAFAQVGRGVGLATQHRQHVACLQRRTDATAHRLAAVGEQAAQAQTEMRGHGHQARGQVAGRVQAADLGGGADRDVDHHVAGAGGDLLRQHRGDQLAFGVDVQLALHAHEDVVGRGQMHGPAPGQAGAFGLDHAAQGIQVQVHRRQGFHGVGGAGRRGDRARGGLGHHQAVGRGDGHHQRRGAVARQAADAMLVHHQRRGPGQALADLDHGPGQVHGLGLVQRQGGRGGEEGRQLHVGVAATDHVEDDGGEVAGFEPSPMHAAAHAGQRFQYRWMPHLHAVAVADAQRRPGRFGQHHQVTSEQVAIGLVEQGLHLAVTGHDQHLRARGQALGMADVAVHVHDRDALVLGMQAHAHGAQAGMAAVAAGIAIGHSG